MTPIERQIYELVSKRPRTCTELIAQIWWVHPQDAPKRDNIKAHVWHLNQELKRRGEMIRAARGLFRTMDKHDFEQQFWGNCVNTYGEEQKQLVYALRMGLALTGDWRSSYNIDMRGASVIDIGGGPVSLLLKCANVVGTVVDPLQFPRWVYVRYAAANLKFVQMRGEDLAPTGFDEAWIYNVLQHVDDPARIIANAREIAKTIRLFEWIDIPPHPGHPHMLTERFLAEALGAPGDTEHLNESGCVGRAFFGVFPT